MNEQLDIHGTPFPVVWHQLKLTPDLSFELCISRDETDEISSAIREGSYAFPLPYSLLTAFAPPGGRVLDLGAHVGTFSLYAATQGYEVLAVEASPVNAALLAASIARNPGARIRLEHIAVSNQPGTVEFLAAGPYGLIANSVLRGPTVTISAATVDAILDNAHWDTVGVMQKS